MPKPRPKVLRRVRLLESLHENVHRRLTFVCAPAGYGKTTLLRSFAGDVEMKVCWYQIAPGDLQLAIFFEHIVRAINHTYPGFSERFSPLWTSLANVAPSALATAFNNEVVQSITDYTLLILDDYHLVSQTPGIVQFIETLIGSLPDQLRLVVSSRNVYGIPTAHLYVRQEIAVIAAEDLKFRLQEVQDLARMSYHRGLSAQELEIITRNTEGWALATALALQEEHAAERPIRQLGVQSQLFDYFREELLQSLEEEDIRFLLATSLVDEFTLEQAVYLLERPDAGDTLRELAERNLFISQREQSGGDAYSYHHLFREFLGSQFAQLSSETQAYFHGRAAAWYEGRNEPVLAIQHWFAAESDDQAARLINQTARWAYTSGAQALLEEWYGRVQGRPEWVSLVPELLLNRAKSLINKGQYGDVSLLLDAAEQSFRNSSDYENLANLLVTRGMLHRFKGEYPAAIELAIQAKSLAAKEQVDSYYSLQAERLEGIANAYVGHIQPALELLNHAAAGLRTRLASEPNDRWVHELVATLTDIGFICITNGRMLEAENAYLEALGLSQQVPTNLGDRAICGNNAAYLFHVTGKISEAWVGYEEALEAARESGWRAFTVDILNGQGDLLRDLRALDLAAEKYEDALELVGEDPTGIAIAETHLGLADVERLQGNFSRAQWRVREAARLGKLPPGSLEARVLDAAIYLSMGQAGLALESLQLEQDALSTVLPPGQRLAIAYCLLAIAHLRDSQARAVAEDCLRKALEVTARLGYDSFLLPLIADYPDEMKGLQDSLTSPQLDSLLARSKSQPRGLAAIRQPVPESSEPPQIRLEVTALGRAGVRINGERLADARWQSTGARNLFFYLVERQPVRKDHLALAFWPDFSPGKVNSNFHATLWRARNALGDLPIIHFDDQTYRLHPAVQLHYDVKELEDTLHQQTQFPPDSDRWQELAYLALELYQGDFLSEVDMDWARERANELRRKVLDVLAQLAESHRLAGRPSRALELYLRAIENDPYEDLWRLGVLRCYEALGRRQTARKYYQTYVRLLADELESQPTQELEEYGRTLDS